MKHYIFLPLFFLSISLTAQDPVFSLGDQNQMYNNPAFTGTANKFRFNNSYRIQWPNLSSEYITNSTSADMIFNKIGGIGLSYTHDLAGDIISTGTLSLHYSYGIKINEDTKMRFGISGGWLKKKIDWSKLTFGDMIDPQQGFIYSTQELPRTDKINRLDFSSGLLFMHKNFYFGYAAHHINQPNVGFFSDSRLPLRHSLQTGANIAVGSWNLNLLSLAHVQDGFHNITGIAQAQIKHLIFGGGYNFNNSVLGRMGLAYDHFRLLYGYDHTISKFGSASGGSHEITLQILLHKEDHKNPWAIANY